MFYRYLTFVSVILLLTACKPAYIGQGLKQIDSLEVLLGDVDGKLKDLDTAAIHQKYNDYLESIQQIKQFTDHNYSPDDWSAMTQWGNIRKPVRNFLQQLPGFHEEMNYSRSQLANLRHDLKQKLIERKLFDEYIAKEREEIEFFVQRFDMFYSAAMVQIHLFDSLYPMIQIVIENHDNKDE